MVMFFNTEKPFKTHLHAKIRQVVAEGDIRFESHPYTPSQKYHISEAYHVSYRGTLLDIYRIINRQNGNQESIDLQYHMAIGNTNIQATENNTTFAKDVYESLKQKHKNIIQTKESHVK